MAPNEKQVRTSDGTWHPSAEAAREHDRRRAAARDEIAADYAAAGFVPEYIDDLMGLVPAPTLD